jgi:hypothetical protein
VIKTSGQRELSAGLPGLRAGDGGLIVAVTGQLTAGEAHQLAACRRDQCQGIALLLAVSTWADQPSGPAAGAAPGPPDSAAAPPGRVRVAHDETAEAAGVLRQAGWRVISVDSTTSLAAAWQELPRFADRPVPMTGFTNQDLAGGTAR